ncbi:hypothetical protein QE152_g6947 [Popillia japonica]|uniref:Uncharacterized protein n=1 Tax=Popillia japonica TaxID=7064 RepID=A0AAW1MI79_POPJA
MSLRSSGQVHAAQMSLRSSGQVHAAQGLRSSGQVHAAQVLKDVTSTSPTRASKYISAVRSQNEVPLTPDEALSLMIEKGESKRSYQLSRNAARAHNCKLYPSYHEVEKARNRCYPSVVYTTVSESCAQIKLQALLDHTTYRIIQLQAVTDIEQQIGGLAPYATVQNGKSISVTYCMSFTMIDGKVCNAVTGTTSAQRCFLCKATSKQFNDIDNIIKMDITTDNLRFGISTLHAWIRFFDCCLHLSYKLTTEKWQARQEEVKRNVKMRKEEIQTQFKIKLGTKGDTLAYKLFSYSDICIG